MKTKCWLSLIMAAALFQPARGQSPSSNGPAGGETADQAESGKGLRLNFRGVPLDMVLEYLSDAAGFIINLETQVSGKVDVWSNQPLTKDEAVALLNSVLNRNGYAAIRNGRTLTVVTQEEAKRRNIPVKAGANPENIPVSDEMVTQIIPVRYINAVQLVRDLEPLKPEKASITANEGGNALVITDTQSNIRRLAEIVQALDTAIASISTVRVYPLRYADAKALATVIKEVFQTPTSGTDIRSQILNRFRGGGPFGGGPDGGRGGGSNGGGTEGRPGASRVAAVADERSNSLVVSAPDELIPTIEEVVKSVDMPVEDVTEVRVFHLKNSDPTEIAELLAQLFPDDTQTSSGSRAQVQFGGGPFGGFNRGGNNRRGGNGGDESDRMKKQGRVIAVPDPRTSSVVVSASKDLMTQIAEMVVQLDSSTARKQKVFVYSLENADAQNVEEILRGLFENQTTSRNRTTTTGNNRQNNALNQRTTANNQQIGNNAAGGFGGGIGNQGRGQ